MIFAVLRRRVVDGGAAPQKRGDVVFIKASQLTVGYAWCALLGALASVIGCGSDDDGGEESRTDNLLPAVPADVAIGPVQACSLAGIGATELSADAAVTIVEVSTERTASGPMPGMGGAMGVVASGLDKPYCLVKVRVDPQINIWVAMPTQNWNGRLRAEGGGGYSGALSVAVDSVNQDFVGMRTDTGHPGGVIDGAFGMLSPGVPDTQLQNDFAHRSEHLMAVIGKQLARAYYGQAELRSYWFGCSTGGRQGLMMAQRYPEDYDAIVAGAPAIHWDRFQAYQIWPQMVMNVDVGAPIAPPKLELATQRAIASCDDRDGLRDGVIDDPRDCQYAPAADTTITRATCTAADVNCLTVGEARAIEKIWGGARTTGGSLLWPGLERGTGLLGLAGPMPFPITLEQAKYWVYLDPNWDWKTLNYENFEAFFDKTVEMVGPMIATDDPDLSDFAERGGKLLLFHGWTDPLIMPQGTVRYYEAMVETLGAQVDRFAKLFMVPGMDHCSGGAGPNSFGYSPFRADTMADPEHDIFRALMAWSERGVEPEQLVATKFEDDDPARAVQTTRPLCSYPAVARYEGSGSTDDAANFRCEAAR
jgi:pimeloyl-ACP methyl ester carboxylesterase